LLTRAIGLLERRVSEVMVPRPDVVWLAHDDTAAELLAAAVRTGHSRFPVHRGSEDEVTGTVHVKDLLRVASPDRSRTTVGELAAPCLVVPESFELRQLLARMRHEQRTFAVVVDEYGGTAGIVTMEDVLEELVGDIEDEFDRDVGSLRRIGAGRYLVHGTLRAERLADALAIGVPEGGYETAAGFVLHLLGRIPSVGDALEHDGWRIEVTAMDGLRVAQLRFEQLTPPSTGDVAP
jgi:CBS domain containing-hemolysin-like protein